MDKTLLRQAILEKLQADFDLQTRAALMAREEATNEESKATSKYETHSTEAAYLAESQSRLASEAQDSMAFYRTLAIPDFTNGQQADIGAVVCLEYRGRDTWYFLGPRNGGIDIDIGERQITLVTPTSPLGRQILGARIGDTVQLPGRSTPQPHRIAAIL